MNSTPSRKIDFRKQRDFSAIFSDAFKYFKFNFKHLILSVLLLAGPLLIIAGGLNGYLQSIGSNPSALIGVNSLKNPMSALNDIISVMLPFLFFAMLGAIVYSAVVSRFLILSQQKSEGEEITIAELLRHLPKDTWRLFYNYLLLGLVASLFALVIVVIAFIPVLGIILIIVGLILAGPNISYAVSNASYLVLRDEISILAAFSKTMNYMRGNWWATWAIVFCSMMIVGVASLIFTLPQAVYSIITTFSRMKTETYTDETTSLWFIVFAIIAMLGQHLLSPLMNIFYTLTYHSHEESEEGTGLKSKIEEIGSDN